MKYGIVLKERYICPTCNGIKSDIRCKKCRERGFISKTISFEEALRKYGLLKQSHTPLNSLRCS